jgi:transposase
MRKIGGIEVRRQEGVPAPKRPPEGTAVWMAIDVSRSKAVYCLRWNGSEQRRLSTPLGIEHVRALVEHYRGCRLHVAYEACGFGYELAWWLQAQGTAVSVIAPSRVERVPGLQVKTDRVDVGKLARKLEKGDLKAIYIPTRAGHERRQLGRTYAQSLKERKRAQVRIRSLMQEQGRLGPLPKAGWTVYSAWLAAQQLPEPIRLCVEVHQQLRRVADQQAQRMKAELYQLARSIEYRTLVKALMAQSGVGWHSAIRLVLELGDIDRFRTSDALPHYLGLTPSQYSSGEVDHRGHTLKCGPGFLRALLLQCAWSAVRHGRDRGLTEYFERLAPRTGRKRAIVAVARKLAIKLRTRWRQYLVASAPAPTLAA